MQRVLREAAARCRCETEAVKIERGEVIMGMGISELMATVGDENIEFQVLDTALIEANVDKAEAEITFGTQPDKVMNFLLDNHRKYVGLVVWLPIEKMPEKLRPKVK